MFLAQLLLTAVVLMVCMALSCVIEKDYRARRVKVTHPWYRQP